MSMELCPSLCAAEEAVASAEERGEACGSTLTRTMALSQVSNTSIAIIFALIDLIL
jgi:hypothetical protein